jgi:membrane protein required for colicin V production
MNGFDWIVLGVIAVSALSAFARGIVRSLIALVAWVVGLVAAIAYAPHLAALLPEMSRYPFVPHLIAFALIFVAVLVLGALVAWPLRAVIHGAGLGFVDRALGSLFGVARGIVLVLGFVLVAGVTALPAADWWQNSIFAQPLSEAALALRPWLPRSWADQLDYSGRRRPGVDAAGSSSKGGAIRSRLKPITAGLA